MYIAKISHSVSWRWHTSPYKMSCGRANEMGKLKDSLILHYTKLTIAKDMVDYQQIICAQSGINGCYTRTNLRAVKSSLYPICIQRWNKRSFWGLTN